MRERNLYRIVEVSMKRESGRKEIGIMTVRQALELPQVPSLEYSHPELNSRPTGASSRVTNSRPMRAAPEPESAAPASSSCSAYCSSPSGC